MVQLAPYNTQYERLTAHMAAAGVQPSPNLWDQPVSLAREHRAATPDSHSSPRADSMAPPGSPRLRIDICRRSVGSAALCTDISSVESKNEKFEKLSMGAASTSEVWMSALKDLSCIRRL